MCVCGGVFFQPSAHFGRVVLICIVCIFSVSKVTKLQPILYLCGHTKPVLASQVLRCTAVWTESLCMAMTCVTTLNKIWHSHVMGSHMTEQACLHSEIMQLSRLPMLSPKCTSDVLVLLKAGDASVTPWTSLNLNRFAVQIFAL